MKAFVSGGAGFIGSHLVDRLLLDGYNVIVFDNLFRGKKSNLSKHQENKAFRFIEGDIRNYRQIHDALGDGVDLFYHLAAQSNVMGAVTDIDYSFETNVLGTYNVLKASENRKVRRFIFTSSRESYGEARYIPVDEEHPLMSKNSYGASKVAGETYCRVFAGRGPLEVAILRFANVYGERDFNRVIPIFLENIRQGKDLTIFGGKQVIDFVSIEIIIEALMQSAKNREILNGPVNVGSGKGTTLFELAHALKDISQADFEIHVEPARSEEVVRFVASVERFNRVFDIRLPENPLYYLARTAQEQKMGNNT